MTRAGTGLLALAGSVVLHVGVAAVILPTLAARNPPQQTGVQSELALSTVQVRRSRAQSKAPEAAAADRMKTSGARIGSGGIARTRAPAQAIAGTLAEAQTVTGIRARAQPVGATSASARVPSAPPAAGQEVTGKRAVAQDIHGIRTAARKVPAMRAPVTAVTGTRRRAAAVPQETLAELAASGAVVRPVPARPASPPASVGPVAFRSPALDPDPDRRTATAITSRRAARLTPEAPVIAAGLAWSGSGTLSLDAQSVATLAAFLQPGDVDSQQVRDAMADIMAAPPCARIHTVFDPVTGALDLRGHVPDAAARAPLMAAMRAQIGGGLPVRDLLRILPEPQCGLLDAIAALGLPQSEEQLTDSDLVGEHAQVREYAFTEGDRLVIDLTAPDYPAYVYVDYFDAAGQVIHLRPNAQSALERMPPDAVFSVGRGPDMDLRIAAPFGQDIAAAFATSVPLYDGLRPLVEPAGPYLDILRELVARKRQAHPDFRGEWVYLFVATTSLAGNAAD